MKTRMTAAISIIAGLLMIAAIACGGSPASPAPTQTPTGTTGEATPDPTAPPSPTADLTHGSPQPSLSTGSPLQSLTFDGVDYVYSGYAEQPSGEGTVFVIDGIEINLDVLEMVGTTHEGRTAGIQDGLMVYRLKTGGTNEVYTFRPGKDHVNPEDGQIFKGQDSWTRWTAS